MSNLSYWEKRFLQTKASQLKSTEAYERALQPQLKGLQHELDIEMNKYYRRYSQTNEISEEETRKILNNIGNSNWKMTLDQFKQKAVEGGHQNELDSEYFKSRIARLQNLESQLKQRTGNFAEDQKNSMKDALAKRYGESYMRTIFNSQSAHFSYSGNFAHLNDNQLRAIVSKPWKGSNFSKRIWNNYQKELPDKLMDSILRGSLMGYHPSKISRMMHAKFQDVSKKDIHRLVTTEFGHVNEEATAQGYEESGIDEYQYMATLESHTCMVCAHLDGQIFKLSDRKDGINYPTIHPYCRCTTVPYIADLPEVGERWMRDPETGEGKLTNNMSFKKWNSLYGNSTKSSKTLKLVGIDPHDKSKWPTGVRVAETLDGDKVQFESEQGMALGGEWLEKLLKYADDDDLIESIESYMGNGRFGNAKQYKDIADWVKNVNRYSNNENVISNIKNNKFSIDDIRPKNIIDFDIDSASRKQLISYIKDNFDMNISETKNARLSDLALVETVKTMSSFKNIYQALPEKIPVLRAITPKEANNAIAWYSRDGVTNSPIEFALNTYYFENKAILTNTMKQGVQIGWFSNNDKMNHVMVHEFSHHIDKQLSKVMGDKSFSSRLFRTIEKDYDNFSIEKIGGYALKSYSRSFDCTEPFAEIFTEAYGPTPSKQALIFKKYFEEMATEVLNNA